MPSEYTSVRVSISSPSESACSGLMYSGVPIITPKRVEIVSALSFCASALATPKSMIFAIGFPSTSVTRMLEGFRSRWIMAF